MFKYSRIMIIFILICSICGNARAENAVSELGDATQGFAIYFEKAAVVGKLIDYCELSGVYIVYGRLSTCEGYDGIWRVFQTGRFYEIVPGNFDVEERLPAYMGIGVKLFGSMETGPEGRSVLYARDLMPYEPAADLQEGNIPAWKEGEEPDQDWIGFGIQKDVYSAALFPLNTSTALVESILPLKFIFCSGGRRFACKQDYPGAVDIVDMAQGKRFGPEQVARIWKSDPFRDVSPAFIPDSQNPRELHRRLLANIKERYPFQPVFYLITSFPGYAEASRAVGGFVFVRAMKGVNNSYIQSIPVIRSDLERFMNAMEEAPDSNSHSEWASPALFYGSLCAHYRSSVDENGLESMIYDYAIYNGPFFPRDEPEKLLDTIEACSRLDAWDEIINGQDVFYRVRESWKLYGLTEAEALEMQAQGYSWFTGTRCLEYLYTPPDGGEPVFITLEEGSHQGDPSYTLLDNYIRLQRVDWQKSNQASSLGKGEFSFILDCLLDMAVEGGF